MKIAYISLYTLSIAIFLIALLGSNMTKPLFDSLSEKTLEFGGFEKVYVESVDNRIDELIYKSKQIELQIEKLKKFFSSESIDETKYQKEKNSMIEKTIYDPIVLVINYAFRISFIFISLITLCFAVIFHVVYRSFDLRRRVRKLEHELHRLVNLSHG